MSMSSHSILCTRTVWIVIANISNVLNLALLPIQGWLSIDTILKNALVDKKGINVIPRHYYLGWRYLVEKTQGVYLNGKENKECRVIIIVFHTNLDLLNNAN